MREEHEEKLIKDASKIAAMDQLKKAETKLDMKPSKQEHKECGFVTVCAGEGLAEIFSGLGADYVIEGGQTMNPLHRGHTQCHRAGQRRQCIHTSKQQEHHPGGRAGCKDQQGCKYIRHPDEDHTSQGITALINYCDGVDPEDNAQAMTESLQTVKSGQVTYAVRHTQVDGKEIHEGDIMGIGDRGILSVGQILNETALDLIKAMADEDSELVTVYRGEESPRRMRPSSAMTSGRLFLQWRSSSVWRTACLLLYLERGISMTELTGFKGIGDKTAEALVRLGISCAEDMVFYFPRDYEEFEAPREIYALTPGRVGTVLCELRQDAAVNRYNGMVIVNVYISDMTGRLQISWYNMPYIRQKLKAGSRFVFRGRVYERMAGSS